MNNIDLFKSHYEPDEKVEPDEFETIDLIKKFGEKKEPERFYCNLCGETPCEFIVDKFFREPLCCPFDKRFNANWKRSK